MHPSSRRLSTQGMVIPMSLRLWSNKVGLPKQEMRWFFIGCAVAAQRWGSGGRQKGATGASGEHCGACAFCSSASAWTADCGPVVEQLPGRWWVCSGNRLADGGPSRSIQLFPSQAPATDPGTGLLPWIRVRAGCAKAPSCTRARRRAVGSDGTREHGPRNGGLARR